MWYPVVPPLPEAHCRRTACGSCGLCMHACRCVDRLRELRDRLRTIVAQNQFGWPPEAEE